MSEAPVFDFPADAGVSAAALHLLLATHPELVDIGFEWRIGSDAVIRPGLPVDHPQAGTGTVLLAKALELPLMVSRYTSGADGVRRFCAAVDGRWGGAQWRCTNYGTEQAPTVLRAVTS